MRLKRIHLHFWGGNCSFYDFLQIFKKMTTAHTIVDEELLVSLAGAPIRPIAQKCAKWVRVLWKFINQPMDKKKLELWRSERALRATRLPFFLLQSSSPFFLFFFSLMSASFELAEHIAAMSPVAIQGTKVNLNYARDHSVQEGLDFVVSLYSAHIIISCFPFPCVSLLLNSWKTDGQNSKRRNTIVDKLQN